MKKAKALGRPPKLSTIALNLEQVEAMAGLGLSEDEISRVLGCCRSSIVYYKKHNKKFREALLAGKAKADMNVLKGLYTRATSGASDTAAIFWLKNRQPDRWRDRRESVITPGGDGEGLALRIEVVHTRDAEAGKGNGNGNGKGNGK